MNTARLIVEGAEPPRTPDTSTRSVWLAITLSVSVAVWLVSAPTGQPDRVAQADEIRPPEISSMLTVLDPFSPTHILVVPTPLDERTAAQLTSVDGGVMRTRALDNAISAGIGRGLLGVGDQRLRIVGDDAVYVSLGQTVIVPLESADRPIEVGRGVYLLSSATDGRVWIVGSGARWVRHLDVESRSAGPEVRLDDIGRPLAAVSGGLLLSLRDPTPGALALWTEDGQVTSLPLDPTLDFIAAAGETVVLSDGDSLLTHEISRGATRPLAIDHAEFAQPNEFIISPLGTRVAIARGGTVADLPVVEVFDLLTGRQIMEIDPALGWQLQWISEKEVLFLDPTGGEYALSIADVEAGATRQTIGLSGAAFWFAGRAAP